jgi:hypothetical protein
MFYNEEEIFRELFDKAIQSGNVSNYEYIGRLLLPGEDASIIVKKSSMTVTIGDVPARKDHPINAFVTYHEEEIREITAEDLRSHQEIVIAGRWHLNRDCETESFEPYLTRRIADASSAKTSKYDYDFFGFGGYGNSIELCQNASGEGAFAFMVAVTAHITDYSHLSPGLAESMGFPTGMVWYPVSSELPFLVVEHAMKTREQRLACC